MPKQKMKEETQTQSESKVETNQTESSTQTETNPVETPKQSETNGQTSQVESSNAEANKNEESTIENRTLPQWALDAAARSEQAIKDEEARIKAEKAEAAAKAKAEREAKAADEERARQELEAWEAEIKKQSDVVNGYDTYDKEYHFKSAPSNAAEERYIQSLDRVKSGVTGIVETHGNITVNKTDNLKNSEIWWVEMSCDLSMCDGFTGHFNTAKVSVRLEGLRDSVGSITLTAPTAKASYKFVGWKTYTVRYNGEIDIRGYEAVYEKL